MSEQPVPMELGPDDEVTLIMTVEVRYSATRRYYSENPDRPTILPTDNMMAEADETALRDGDMSMADILGGAERQNVTLTVRAE